MKNYPQLGSPEAYKAFYDEQGHHYGNDHLDENFPRAKFILDRVRSWDKVVELGCQTGGITRLVAPRVGWVIANELSESYQERAGEVLDGIGNVALVAGFAEEALWVNRDNAVHALVSFADKTGRKFIEVISPHTVDVVIAMELLEHVIDPDALCESIVMQLRPWGRALFSVPKDYIDPLDEHVREFTKESLKELLGRHFRSSEIVDAGDWYLAEALV